MSEKKLASLELFSCLIQDFFTRPSLSERAEHDFGDAFHCLREGPLPVPSPLAFLLILPIYERRETRRGCK